MKHLFLCSQINFVSKDIAHTLGDQVKQSAVYITTAIHDKHHHDLSWHEANRAELVKVGFNFDEYDITGKSEQDIKNDLAKYTIMYVEGGNSFFLLQESQKNNFGKYVKERVNNGLIYMGSSAGSAITGPDIDPLSRIEQTSLAPDIKGTIGFGIVDFVVMPHWGNLEKRHIYLDGRIDHIYNINYPYILLTDNQYIEVVGDTYKIIDVTKE